MCHQQSHCIMTSYSCQDINSLKKHLQFTLKVIRIVNRIKRKNMVEPSNNELSSHEPLQNVESSPLVIEQETAKLIAEKILDHTVISLSQGRAIVDIGELNPQKIIEELIDLDYYHVTVEDFNEAVTVPRETEKIVISGYSGDCYEKDFEREMRIEDCIRGG